MDIVEKNCTQAGDSNDYGVHDITFVEIITTIGCATLVNHNEHNGYYGGFDMRIEEKS